ncbi:MAG: MFS transporter, partial [Streptosporangiaceae bacterium]
LDLTGACKGQVFAVLGISLLSGAALMVTLVDVELVGQTLLGRSSGESALILARFLVALAVAAAGGGWIAHRFGDRWPLFTGMTVAAIGYYLISTWPLALADASYGPLARMDVDLVVTGLGLGLVIAPVSSAVLRLVPSGQHGVASSAVVVARMMGMLLGIAALSAYGFHRYVSLTSKLVPPFPPLADPAQQKAAVAAFKLGFQQALHTEYSEIFLITAVLCAVGAVLALTVRDETPAQEQIGFKGSIPDMTTRLSTTRPFGSGPEDPDTSQLKALSGRCLYCLALSGCATPHQQPRRTSSCTG